MWSELSIGQVAEIVGGSTPSTKNPDNFGGDIPWITPKDLSNHQFRYIESGSRNITERGLSSSSAKLIPANSVLLSTRAPVGYVAIARNPLSTNQGFRSLILKDGFDPEFVYYLLQHNVEYLRSHASGTTFAELSGTTLKSLRFMFPPYPEQRAIARILGALDDKIEINRKMNTTLESIAQTLFQSWFVDFDPVHAKSKGRPPSLPLQIADLFPSEFEDSKLGRIPRGWKIGTVVDLCDRIENGGTPNRKISEYWESGKIPWFKTGELTDGPLIESQECITEIGLENSACKIWKTGTVLIALYASPTVGRLGILEVSAASNQACSALSAKSQYGNHFLFYTLLFARDNLQKISVGSAQQNINQQVIREYPVLFPSSSLTGIFQNLASILYRARVSNTIEIENLSSIRNTLLPKLLSGDLRVKA